MNLTPCQTIQVKKCPALPDEPLIVDPVSIHKTNMLKRAHDSITPLVNEANSVIERYQVIQKTNDVNTVELIDLAEEYDEIVYESSSLSRRAVAFLNETVDLNESPDVGQARDVARYIVETCAKINDNARVFTMWTLV